MPQDSIINRSRTFHSSRPTFTLRDVHALLCSACFGPRESTDLPHTAKDVHMAVDANFTHSTLKSSAKYGFANIIPPSFLSKSHVSHAAKQYEESGAEKIRVGKDSSVRQHFLYDLDTEAAFNRLVLITGRPRMAAKKRVTTRQIPGL